MYKKIGFLIAIHFMVLSAFSQNLALKKAYNDPKRAENEAKADVYIQEKNKLYDSTNLGDGKQKPVTRRKKACRRTTDRT